MRNFSNIEKEIIKTIQSKKGGMFAGILIPYLKNITIYVDTREKFARLQTPIDIDEAVDRVTLIEDTTVLILQAVNIIKMLEDKGYIFTYRSGLFANPTVYGQTMFDTKFSTQLFADERLSTLLGEYSTKQIFVTPELDYFVDQNFKTREQLRFKKQFLIACCALCIAFSGAFTNLYFNIKKNSSKQVVKIDSIQNLEIKKEIISIRKLIIEKDSINKKEY